LKAAGDGGASPRTLGVNASPRTLGVNVSPRTLGVIVSPRTLGVIVWPRAPAVNDSQKRLSADGSPQGCILRRASGTGG